MFRNIPPVTRNLIIINILIWLVEALAPGFDRTLERVLSLHYVGAHDFNPVQIFTYMFMHDPRGITHIFFNMFSLWMFGRIMEQVWGAKRFLLFYMVCGVGAALVQEGVWALTWHHQYIEGIAKLNLMPYHQMLDLVNADPAHFAEGMEAFKNSFMTVGASGAVFGILLGFAFIFPDMPMYLFFIPVPIKAKYMVIGYGVIEFFLGIAGAQGTVAHFAHLGGMLFGLAMLLWWKHKGTLRGNFRNF